MNAALRAFPALPAAALAAASLLAGCGGVLQSLPEERLRYNETIKATSEEQLLLNIVRLRYTDSPSSLSVSSVALQTETQRSAGLVPFWGALTGGGGEVRSLSGVLPQAQVQVTDRPTVTLTPLDDQEFTRRLFTPMSSDGVLYLAKTTWPIQTVFRLWLENLNWVSNAQTASGPTPARAPEFLDFQRGVAALQALQDQGLLVFAVEERDEQVGGELPADRVTPRDLVAAAKENLELKPVAEGRGWAVVRKKRVPVMRVHPNALNSPQMREAAEVFRLRRGLSKYDIEIEKLDPFSPPLDGAEIVDLETRSLLQVLYYVSKGVEVPEAHLLRRIAVATSDEDGRLFDWSLVTRGLFRARSAQGDKPPAEAHVAVRYLDHWFYVDRRDAESMATLSLLLELSRLELPTRTGGPTFTLPLGGR